jgi:hypothetical protein
VHSWKASGLECAASCTRWYSIVTENYAAEQSRSTKQIDQTPVTYVRRISSCPYLRLAQACHATARAGASAPGPAFASNWHYRCLLSMRIITYSPHRDEALRPTKATDFSDVDRGKPAREATAK